MGAYPPSVFTGVKWEFFILKGRAINSWNNSSNSLFIAFSAIRPAICKMCIRDRSSVELIFEPGMPDYYVVCSEKNRLQQLVLNFLTNACKFTSTGSIRYGYEVREKEIYYYVTDTGTGIPEDKLHLIFERFIKLDSFKQGTGLGLPICQLIIQNMGGEIGVNSKLGEGSTSVSYTHLIPVRGNRRLM